MGMSLRLREEWSPEVGRLHSVFVNLQFRYITPTSIIRLITALILYNVKYLVLHCKILMMYIVKYSSTKCIM